MHRKSTFSSSQKTRASSDTPKKRQWSNLVKRVRYLPELNPKDNIAKPMQTQTKPTIPTSDDFLKLLCRLLLKKKSQLFINIPKTWFADTGDLIGSTWDSTGTDLTKSVIGGNFGHSFVKEDVTFQAFMQELETANLNFLEQLRQKNVEQYRYYSQKMFQIEGTSPRLPYLFSKSADDVLENRRSIRLFTYQLSKTVKNNKSQHMIIRRFIYPRNSHVLITRFCYKPNKVELSQAYLIRNKEKILSTTTYKKNLLRKNWTIDMSDKESFEIFPIRYQNTSFYLQTAHLTQFLERHTAAKIECIVTDWLQDPNQTYWFCKVQHIVYQQSKASRKLNLDNYACWICCRLCGQRFSKDEAEKIVSNRLIEQLVRHMKQRGRYLNIKVSSNLARSCRLCNVCYKLLTAQYELIAVQKQFGKACGIMPSQETTSKDFKFTRLRLRSHATSSMYQWRMFFYLTELVGLQPNNDNIDLSLSLKLQDINTVFPLGCIKTSNHRVNKLRMYYFLSETQDITNFKTNTQIFVRLVATNKFNTIAQGTLTMAYFSKSNAQKKSQYVLLFYENAKYCEMEVVAGLVCDGLYDVNHLSLQEYRGIYFPNQQYTNANSFPDEWMEVFDEKYSSNKSKMVGEVTQEDVLRMVAGSSDTHEPNQLSLPHIQKNSQIQ